MSELLNFIKQQTTPPQPARNYTDIQQSSLSQFIKSQTARNKTADVTHSTQKYGTVNGETVLPYSIENQGLYDLSKKSKFDYFADGVAKGTVGSIAQAGEALKQSLTGETGKADRALYDFTMESAYNPSKANQLQYYIAQKQNADRNTYLNTDTFGYKMLNSAQKDMQKATEGMGETGKFLTNVAGTVAQNALVAPLAFVNPSLAAGVMATSAAGHSIKQQADSGKTLKEANFRGAVDGLIEYGLGKIGIDAYLDNVIGNGNVLRNIGKNMLSEGGEEALSYLANYGVDKISGNSDAEFDWKEFWYNILAGATAGGVLGTGGAAIGQMGKNISATTDIPQIEFDVDYFDADNDAQYYRPFDFDRTDSIDTEYKGLKCKATKVIGYDYKIYVSDKVKIKRKRLHYVNTRVNTAIKMIGAKNSYEKPRIIICDITELPSTTEAAYTASDNTLRINCALTDRKYAIDSSKTGACPDNHNSTYVHEMLHWYDAQRYIETHGTTDGYLEAIKEESKKQLEQLEKRGYNIYNISPYATTSIEKNNPDETWTEYRVKRILERK